MNLNAIHRECAELTLSTRPFAVKARVQVTAGGLLAIAALVSGILLSTAVVVYAAKH